MITFILWFLLAMHVLSTFINISQIGKPRAVLTPKTVAIVTAANGAVIAAIAVVLFRGGA